jgi:hypothetical protein
MGKKMGSRIRKQRQILFRVVRCNMKNRIISPFFLISLFCVSNIGCSTTETVYCVDRTTKITYAQEQRPWKTRTYWGGWEPWGEWYEAENAELVFVTITSDPSGAQVLVNGNSVGNTPLILKLKVPVLMSRRHRYQYQETIPGWSEPFHQEGNAWASKISSESEERYKSGSRTYVVELRKEGCFSMERSFSVSGTASLHFTLERKPTLFIKGFRVKDNVKLSWAEHLYDLIYGKRFAADTSKFKNINKNYLDTKPLTEYFVISPDENSDYSLEGEIIIEKKITEIRIALIDKEGRPVTTRRTSMETKNIRDLYLKIEILIGHIRDSFSKR